MKEKEKRELSTLIFYPKSKMDESNNRGTIPSEWYKEALDYMIKITREVSSIYTSINNNYRYWPDLL